MPASVCAASRGETLCMQRPTRGYMGVLRELESLQRLIAHLRCIAGGTVLELFMQLAAYPTRLTACSHADSSDSRLCLHKDVSCVCSGLSAAVCISGHAGVSSSPDSCTECPVGFYSGGGPKGSTLCQPCVNGTSTPVPGTAALDNCTGAAQTACFVMRSYLHLILNCSYSDEAATVASTRAALSHRQRSSACCLCSNTRSPGKH